MTPEEITAIIEDHKYPTLHAGDTGINVITLQIWLQMLGFYQGPITGLLDAFTAQAVDAFRAQQRAAGVALQAPTGAVLDRDIWEAMDNLLQQRLPPDLATLERQPFPRRSAYDSEAKYRKALYEGLRAFGFPVKPAQEPLRLPLVINESGVAILHGLPPGSYTLELDDAASPGRGSADLHLDNADGTPFGGRIRLVRDGAEQSATVVDGHVLVNGLEPGDYQVVVDRVDTDNQIIDDTGSLEIRLCDANNRPIGGVATLVGETGDVATLQQAVRLFQALLHKIDRGLDPGDRSGLDRNILTGEFAETAHKYHESAWDNFERTWGRFYGAPWMGVTFHPLDRGAGPGQDDLNWGERETVTRLYEWGNAYLQASQDADELKERLQRPIAVRYIARMLGGRVDQRTDFSQIGTYASIHLPHKAESMVGGVAIGQTYGGIDYDSPYYSSPHLEAQVAAFTSSNDTFVTQCPDDVLVNRLLLPDLQPFARRLIVDRYARNRSINNCIGNLRPLRLRNARNSSEEKSSIYAAVADSHLDLTGSQLDLLFNSDIEFYNTTKINLILQDPLFTQRISTVRFQYLFVLGVIRETQKALWWCRFLLHAGRPSEVKTLSDRFIAKGYKGLFLEYNKASNWDALDKKIIGLAFDDNDWKNPWQLEALVEIYINFDDPWDKKLWTNKERLPGGKLFKNVSEEMSKNLHFVLVDPLGSRLNGNLFSVNNLGTENTVVNLGTISEEEFQKVNPKFDTIHFPDDRRTYRIKKIDVKGHSVIIDTRESKIDKITGPWQIPAGVGGQLPTRYPASDKLALGYDHYDGALFVVKDGVVQGRYSFTSYTSRRNTSGPPAMSLRGNRSYNIFSWRAGNEYANCSFAVETPASNDGRYYFNDKVSKGDESDVFIHYGFILDEAGDKTGTHSKACHVSPAFFDLRDLVLSLYPRETAVRELDKKWQESNTPGKLKKDLKGLEDYKLNLWKKVWDLLHAKTYNESLKLSKNKTAIGWNHAIHGTLWLIRPDELPLD